LEQMCVHNYCWCYGYNSSKHGKRYNHQYRVILAKSNNRTTFDEFLQPNNEDVLLFFKYFWTLSEVKKRRTHEHPGIINYYWHDELYNIGLYLATIWNRAEIRIYYLGFIYSLGASCSQCHSYTYIIIWYVCVLLLLLSWIHIYYIT